MFVLDTCAVYEAMSINRNDGFTHWLAGQQPDRLATTVITVTEITHGLLRMPEGKRRDGMVKAAETLFRRLHIYGQDRAGAWLAGEMIVLEERAGRTLKFADASIAAITHRHEGKLVTRDADFEGLSQHPRCQNFTIVNPWS